MDDDYSAQSRRHLKRTIDRRVSRRCAHLTAFSCVPRRTRRFQSQRNDEPIIVKCTSYRFSQTRETEAQVKRIDERKNTENFRVDCGDKKPKNKKKTIAGRLFYRSRKNLIRRRGRLIDLVLFPVVQSMKRENDMTVYISNNRASCITLHKEEEEGKSSYKYR